MGLRLVAGLKIIADNVNALPDREFASAEEFWHHLGTFDGLFTEPNLNRVLRGFLSFADEIDEAQLERAEFRDFLEKTRFTYAELYRGEEFCVNLARFLDLFCVDYPEIWVKLDKSGPN